MPLIRFYAALLAYVHSRPMYEKKLEPIVLKAHATRLTDTSH